MNKGILVLILVVCTVLLSVNAVCANDIASAADNSSGLSESDASSFNALNSTINSGKSVIDITADYEFDNQSDKELSGGIVINQNNTVINGNNHIIDAKGQSRIFIVMGWNITINDLILKNANGSAVVLYGGLETNNVEFNNCSSDMGAALNIMYSDYTSTNDLFINNYASQYGTDIYSMNSYVFINHSSFENDNEIVWSSVYSQGSNLDIINVVFANMTSRYATAIYSNNGQTYIRNSRFINLASNVTAGAIAFKGANNVTIEDCDFINVSSQKNGGAIFADINAAIGADGSILINNTLFSNCSSEFGGAYLQLGGDSQIINSDFTENYAVYNGGAVYISDAEISIEDCVFEKNNVDLTDEDYPTYGGALFIDFTKLEMDGCRFIDNHAIEGSAFYSYDSEYHIDDSEFSDNVNPVFTVFDFEGAEIGELYGNDEIYPEDINNTYYPSVVDGEGMEIPPADDINITEIPARYDLREENLVTPVRNQGSMGSCWTFGMMAALESALLKTMNLSCDFSENNMQNSMLQYSSYGRFTEYEGGSNVNGIAYLVSWLGTFSRDYDSYDELGKISPLIRTDEDVHVQDFMFIRNTPGDEDSLNRIKEAILKYGALDACILSKSSSDDGAPTGYYNENTSAQYAPDHNISNHEVCIVGWDDSFSKDNFIFTPEGDGAWIVKNSWGTEWGDEGYFYVSYYDQTLSAFPTIISESLGAVLFENTIPYTKNYQYDFSGLEYFYGDNSTLSYANIFEAYEDDLIAAVGTYFNESGVEYKIEIEVNDKPVYSQTGVSPFYGYHTIKLDSYVYINKGDNFTVIMTSDLAPICRESRVHYKKDSSVIVYSSGEYEDLGEENLSACLKAYTLADDSLMIPVSDEDVFECGELFRVMVVTSDGHPVAGAPVQFSIANMTYEVLTDADGIAAFEIPFLNPGNYTLTAIYKNQTINVTVVATADIENETAVENPSKKADLDIQMHSTGNPIFMIVLSLFTIAFSIKKELK